MRSKSSSSAKVRTTSTTASLVWKLAYKANFLEKMAKRMSEAGSNVGAESASIEIHPTMLKSLHMATVHDMQVTLTKEQEQWLKEQVALGRFSSPDEAVQEALSLLKEDVSDFSWAKPFVDEGLAELDRGKGIPAEQVYAEVRKKVARR